MSLTTTIQARLDATLSRTTGNVTPVAKLAANWSKSLTSGNGTGQANLIVQEQYSISSAGTQVVDLNAIANDLGETQTWTGVKAIMVWAPTTNATTVTLSDNVTEGFADWLGATGDGVKIPPGGS